MSQHRHAHVIQAHRTNRLLAALPPDEIEALRPDLENVPLECKQLLYAPGQPTRHAWFPHRGVGSLVAPMPDSPPVEIATVGPEGMIGVQIALGDDTIGGHKAIVQVPGEAARIETDALRRAIERSPVLNRLLLRYSLSLMTQIAQNATCNRVHTIEERCARWLVMTHDRVHQASFPLTQEFLAQMLGVRQPSVSIATGMLTQAGFIRYLRGNVTIVDRPGLEAAACDCYRLITAESDRLVGSRASAPQPGAVGSEDAPRVRPEHRSAHAGAGAARQDRPA